MSSSDHADLEALSAYIDGEAPEWADHVAGCEVCRGQAAELRAVALAVGRRVDPPAPAVREAAIAAALDSLTVPAPVAAGPPSRLAPDRHEAERARFAGRRSPRPWALPAVAAVVLAALGMAGVILSSYRSSDDFTTVAGPALESNKAARDTLAGAPQAPVTDLGDVANAATLRARAQLGAPVAAGAAAGTGRSSSSASSGVASDSSASNSGATGAATVTVPPNATSGASGAAAPQLSATPSGGAGGAATVVGTRPCEEQARNREPGLGPVVYFATARRGTVEGYVLGFTPVGASSPVTLLLLAQDGCRELLRSAGP